MLRHLPILLLLFANSSHGYYIADVTTTYKNYGRENECLESIKALPVMRFIPKSVKSDDDYKTGTLKLDIILPPHAMLLMKIFAHCDVLSYNEHPQHVQIMPLSKPYHFGKCLYASHKDYTSSENSCTTRCTDGFFSKYFLLNSIHGYVHVLYVWRVDYPGGDQCLEKCKWDIMADDRLCRKLDAISYIKSSEFPDRQNQTSSNSEDDAANLAQNEKFFTTFGARLQNILATETHVCLTISKNTSMRANLRKLKEPDLAEAIKRIRQDMQGLLYIHSWNAKEIKVVVFDSDKNAHIGPLRNTNKALKMYTKDCSILKKLLTSNRRRSPRSQADLLSDKETSNCFLRSTLDSSLDCDKLMLKDHPITETTSLATCLAHGLQRLKDLKKCGFLKFVPSVFCAMEHNLLHKNEAYKVPGSDKYAIRRYDFDSHQVINEACAACFLAHHEIFLVSTKNRYIWASETNFKYADKCKSTCSGQVKLQNCAEVVQYDEVKWNTNIHQYVNSLSHAAAMNLIIPYKTAKESKLDPNSKPYTPLGQNKHGSDTVDDPAVHSSNQANMVSHDGQLVHPPESSSIAQNDGYIWHPQNHPFAYDPSYTYQYPAQHPPFHPYHMHPFP